MTYDTCSKCKRVDELGLDWLCLACRIDSDPGDEQRQPTDRETYNRSWAGGGVEGGIPYTDTTDWRLT